MAKFKQSAVCFATDFERFRNRIGEIAPDSTCFAALVRHNVWSLHESDSRILSTNACKLPAAKLDMNFKPRGKAPQLRTTFAPGCITNAASRSQRGLADIQAGRHTGWQTAAGWHILRAARHCGLTNPMEALPQRWRSGSGRNAMPAHEKSPSEVGWA